MNRRHSDRNHKRPHQIAMFLKGEEVGLFSIAWTDPRFVNGEQILVRALEVAHTRPSRRHDDSNLFQPWDELRLHWGMGTYSCDPMGQKIPQIG